MKKVPGIFFITLCFLLLSNTAFASRGYIVYTDDNIMVIETNYGYTCVELYSYAPMYESDYVVGEFESYGMHEIYDMSMDTSNEVYVDDYGLSSDEVIRWIGDNS